MKSIWICPSATNTTVIADGGYPYFMLRPRFVYP